MLRSSYNLQCRATTTLLLDGCRDLFTTFAPFGNIISARIMVERETGRSRGFGCVRAPGFPFVLLLRAAVFLSAAGWRRGGALNSLAIHVLGVEVCANRTRIYLYATPPPACRFVSYETPAAAFAAIQAMDGFSMGKKRLKVTLKKENGMGDDMQQGGQAGGPQGQQHGVGGGGGMRGGPGMGPEGGQVRQRVLLRYLISPDCGPEGASG